MAIEPTNGRIPSAKDDVIRALTELAVILEKPPPEVRGDRPGFIHPYYDRGLIDACQRALKVLEETDEYVEYAVDLYTVKKMVNGIRQTSNDTPYEDRQVLASRIRHVMANAHDASHGHPQVRKFDWERNTSPLVWTRWMLVATYGVMISVFQRGLLFRAAIILGSAAIGIIASSYYFHKLPDTARLSISIGSGGLIVALLNAIWPPQKK